MSTAAAIGQTSLAVRQALAAAHAGGLDGVNLDDLHRLETDLQELADVIANHRLTVLEQM